MHLVTGCWQLNLLAMKSRLGMLSSLIATGLPLLWAALQSEGKWCDTLQADLRVLKEVDDALPPADAASWPLWWTMIAEGPKRFKSRVKRLIAILHARQVVDEAVHVGLWGLYKQACARVVTAASGPLRCYCRKCDRTFATRAGLGAHHYKVHQRPAEYRKYIEGTICRGCGKDFYTHASIATHLRANRSCVEAIKARFPALDVLPAGHGSKEWRQLQLEQYTLAPKQPRAGTTEVVDWTWAATVREAYQQLCAAFLDRRDWFQAADIQRTVLDVFGEYPLFDDEERDILDVIVEEIRELAADGDGDPWPAHVAQALIEVLREPDWLLRSRGGTGQNGESCYKTFKEFDRTMDSVPWSTIVQQLRVQCGTHVNEPEILTVDWEEERSTASGEIDFSSALRDPTSLVPKPVATLWQYALEGRHFYVRATEGFWASPYARPFRAMRAECKPN